MTNADWKDVPKGTVVVTESGEGRFTQTLLDGRHTLVADEPNSVGGDDKGPGPYELLLMSLGACTSMTLRLFADREKWPLERIVVRLRHERRYSQDCADCAVKEVRLDHIEREIALFGPLGTEQKVRLIEIAEKCPVHRTLTSKIVVKTRLANS